MGAMKRTDFEKVWRMVFPLGFLLFFVTLLVLGYSVMKSGLGYMYDADEVARVQEVYLLAHGAKPYVSYYSLYSPILTVFLLPIFLTHGFTFAAIDFSRFVMTFIFFLRIGFV